jgi:hypothetical protein
MNIHADKDFWTNLEWPAAPNKDDYSVFANYCTGRVLLLGSTKLLLSLATEAYSRTSPAILLNQLERHNYHLYTKVVQHWY